MLFVQLVWLVFVVLFDLVEGFHRVCYYTNWSQYRPGVGKFTPDNLNPALCSHIIFAFAKLEGNKLTPSEWNDDASAFSIGKYAEINNMKKQHPGLKTLLAVGGWNAGSLPFSNMALTATSRKEFINHTQYYLRERNFDGLDIDWEYPTQRKGRPEDKQNFVLLLKELAAAFEQDAYHTGRPKLLLSAAVPASRNYIEAGFDIPNVARSLDFINVMTYDLHGSWDPVTGHNSPLYPRATDTGLEATLNTQWALDHWSRMGAPKHKLVVGLGFYGRSFKLESPLTNGFGSPAVGAGPMGNYTKEDGFLAYYEVCEELASGAVRVWDTEQKVPYMYNNDLWVGYDDEQSIREKVQWTKQQGYGGMMVWSLALDDFTGTICNNGPYPLLTAINNEIKRIEQPQTIQFLDPTNLGAGNVVPLGGNSAPLPSAILTNPPIPQAFEHRPSGGHDPHSHMPQGSSPILTNLSGIDLQLSSLPHISIIDHHPSGAGHGNALKTTPVPKAATGHGGPSDLSQASLTDLISQLIHAPAKHLADGHKNHGLGTAGVLPSSAPPVNPLSSGAIIQEIVPSAIPPPSSIITDVVNPMSSPQGPAFPPQGPILPPQGTILPDQGPIVSPEGSIMPPQGSILSDQGSILSDQGSLLPPQGSLLPAQGQLSPGIAPVIGPVPVSSVPDLSVIDSANMIPAAGPITALGGIGVLPAVGRLGGVRSSSRLNAIPNISFSTNSNSSSSSSTSSSESKSRNVSIGIPNPGAGRLNLQDVLKSGRNNLPVSLLETRNLGPPDPLAGLSHGSAMPADSIFSVLEGNLPGTQHFQLPQGSVGTVIPVSNNDNLAQVLSSLGVELPTSSGSVLLPEETRVLTPDRVLDELNFGNILQPRTSSVVSNIPAPSGTIISKQRIRPPIANAMPPIPAPTARRPVQRVDRRQITRVSQPRTTGGAIRRTSNIPRNVSQRQRQNLVELGRVLERRRLLRLLQAARERQRNRSRLAPVQQRRSRTPQRSVLTQRRVVQPAVRRQRIQRIPLSRLGIQPQPQRSRSVFRTTARRTTPTRPRTSISRGLTLLNSGDLPPRLQRAFRRTGSSSIFV